jgi:hypothetical protein
VRGRAQVLWFPTRFQRPRKPHYEAILKLTADCTSRRPGRPEASPEVTSSVPRRVDNEGDHTDNGTRGVGRRSDYDCCGRTSPVRGVVNVRVKPVLLRLGLAASFLAVFEYAMVLGVGHASTPPQGAVSFAHPYALFPGSQFDSQTTRSYANASGWIQATKGACLINLSGLTPNAQYSVWMSTSVTLTESANAFEAGPWPQLGSFTANADGTGSYTCTQQPPAGAIISINTVPQGASILDSEPVPSSAKSSVRTTTVTQTKTPTATKPATASYARVPPGRTDAADMVTLAGRDLWGNHRFGPNDIPCMDKGATADGAGRETRMACVARNSPDGAQPFHVRLITNAHGVFSGALVAAQTVQGGGGGDCSITPISGGYHVGCQASTVARLPVWAPSPTNTSGSSSLTLKPGSCITVKGTRVCSAAASPKSTTRPGAKKGSGVRVLFNRTNEGDYTSAPFVIKGALIGIKYTYDCSSFGDSGNFIVDIESLDGGDDIPVANELGSDGSKIVYGYPKEPGSYYYVNVVSECSWAVAVVGS